MSNDQGSGNRPKNPRNRGRGPNAGGGRDERGGRDARGPGRDNRGPGRDNRGPGRDNRGPATADVELLLIGDKGSARAAIYPNPLPPMWQRMPDVQLFSPGLYLKTGGALNRIDKVLEAKEAVVVALWEDPAQTFRLAGEELRPGVTATLLVPTPLDDGPPWIPVQANVQTTAAEFETGILNPWLDQVATIRFRPEFSTDKGRLAVATAGGAEAASSHSALRETLDWLVAHPTDQTSGARLARRVLIENGHGLQRLGVSLMFAADAERAEALETTLHALAPEVAAPLIQLWGLWQEGDAGHRAGRALALAHLLNDALEDDAPLQRAPAMAILATWLAGSFGARPERRGLQPATTLFVLMRALRMVNRRPDALEHPDAALPAFPLAGAARRRVLLDLSRLPQAESNLECLVRCLAIAEMGHAIARPRRDHLRPFRVAMPWLRAYPIAARTLGGRYDYIISGWSFRGGELRDPGIPDGALRGVFVLDSPAVATARAYARVIASDTRAGVLLADELRTARHPVLEDIGGYAQSEPMAVFAAYKDAVEHENMTRRRLFGAVSAAEWLLTRLERGDDLPEVVFLPPVAPHGNDQGGVRAHFMYWRMYCRSIAWTRSAHYAGFLAEMLPVSGTLPVKLQTELFALLRRWCQQNEGHRTEAQAWIGALDDASARYFDAAAAEHERMDGEWLHQLAGSLAVLDRERFLTLLDRWMEDDRARFDEADRIIDAVRAAGWRREFAATPSYARLHARIATVTGPEGAMARAEWTRGALDHARRASAVRWLLDGRAERALLDLPEFEAWFANDALREVGTPDDVVIRLLEFALRVVSTTRLDRVVDDLDRATSWSHAEFLRALGDAGRPHAVLYRMLSASDAGDEELAREMLARLIETAKGGEALRDAAAHLVRLERERGFDLGSVRAALIDALVAYRPIRQALDGLAAVTDAVRLLEPDPALVAPIVRAAGKWGVETGHPDLLRMVAWAVEREVCANALDAWRVALRSDDASALMAAFAALDVPDSVDKPLAVAEKAAGKDPNRRRARNVMLRLQAAGVWNSAMANAIVDALQAGEVDADTLRARLRAHEKTAVAAWAAYDRGGVGSATPEPEPAEDETSATPAAANEAQNPATARLRRAAFESLTELRKTWDPVLAACTEESEPPPPALLRRAAQWTPILWRVRPELVGILRRLSGQTQATVADPKNVMTGDWWDDTVLELDLDGWRALLETLAALQSLHGWEPGWAVRRDLVALLVRGATAAADEDGNEQEPPAEAADEAAPIDEREPDSDQSEDDEAGLQQDDQAGDDDQADEAQDGGSTEASTSQAPKRPRRRKATDPNQAATERFASAMGANAPLARRRDAFGHGAVPALLKVLIERERGLQIGPKRLDGIAGIQLSWGRRR